MGGGPAADEDGAGLDTGGLQPVQAEVHLLFQGRQIAFVWPRVGRGKTGTWQKTQRLAQKGTWT